MIKEEESVYTTGSNMKDSTKFPSILRDQPGSSNQQSKPSSTKEKKLFPAWNRSASGRSESQNNIRTKEVDPYASKQRFAQV